MTALALYEDQLEEGARLRPKLQTYTVFVDAPITA